MTEHVSMLTTMGDMVLHTLIVILTRLGHNGNYKICTYYAVSNTCIGYCFMSVFYAHDRIQLAHVFRYYTT